MPDPLYSGRYTQGFPVSPAPAGSAAPLGLNGFLALTSGNVTMIFRESRGIAPVTFPIVAGTVYPFHIDFFTAGPGTILGLK